MSTEIAILYTDSHLVSTCLESELTEIAILHADSRFILPSVNTEIIAILYNGCHSVLPCPVYELK